MSLNVIDQPRCAEEERIESLLFRRLGNRVMDLQVEIQSSGLVLHGRTKTFYAKQIAQHAAMELSDLPIVNEIEVR
jgi:hypothetical protein